MAPKGDQEVMYFGPGQPCAGLDYSLPYNCLAPNSLAPGTVNTSQINGFVTSSPWIAGSPYPALAAAEFCIGIFTLTVSGALDTSGQLQTSYTIIVTNVAVYYSLWGFSGPGNALTKTFAIIHTWVGGEINAPYMVPGQACTFIEVNQVLYFTGLMLNGIFSITTANGFPSSFAQATSYVAAQYLAELGGRIIAAQCRFPGGGGTGVNVLPTVAWSGVGEYAGVGAGDPWDPANFAALNGNVGGFNLLADVPDQITGLAGMGQSAVIFRLAGLTQADPNPGSANAGIQPFNFYHLWSSPKGVGAVRGTVAQFGYTCWFLSDDNVYSINLSAGPQPIGPRIIAKIKADKRTADNLSGVVADGTFATGTWYFGSIINVDGQLHYLLTFSAYEANLPAATAPTFTNLVYDFNVSENAWHEWDTSQYFKANGSAFAGLAFSFPITQTTDSFGLQTINGPAQFTQTALSYFMFGAIISFGAVGSYTPSGNLFQIIPFDYDFNSNWINSFVASTYSPDSMPLTNLTFRAEVVTLGHKNAQRRLRVQADNAPMPLTNPTTQQQQATVTFTGALKNSFQKSPLNWTFGSGPNETVQYMQGNYAPQGMPIQTYYADLVLTDEMIQSTIQSNLVDPANPWNSLPAFRLASVSLVLVDPKSTTQ